MNRLPAAAQERTNRAYRPAAPQTPPVEHAPAKPGSPGLVSAGEGTHRMPTHAEVRAIVIGLMLAMFLAALNQTIVATAMPTIGREFADFENLSWIVTAYLLTSTAVAPLYGKLSDVHGRRTMMLAGIGIFVVGSLICALAPNMLTMILGRGLQGLGGGGILPIAQSILADVIAPRARGRWQAYMGSVWVSAGALGPVLGGVVSEHMHWSLVFWVNLPLGLAAALMTHRRLRGLPRHERPRKLDLIGAALMMAAAIPLLLALTWGGARYAWGSLVIVGLIAASALLSFVFSLRLMRAPEPFLPLPVLANPIMRWGTAATSFAMGASIGLTIFVPLYYEAVHGLSATLSGLAMIPIVAMTTPGSIMSGRAMMYLKHYKWVPLVGLIAGIAALGAMAWWPRMSLNSVITLLTVVAVAIGTVYPVATVSIQNSCARHQVGVAMGAMNFFRSLGSALVVAVMGAIVLAWLGASPERGIGAGSFAATAAAQGIDLAEVFRWVFVCAASCLALAFVAMCAMEERPLRTTTAPTAATTISADPGPATPVG
jgi:EmrB/QacA subfamily drug resistance transporter